MHAGEDVVGLRVELVFVEEQAEASARFAANEHILGDAQMIHQLEFLMNDADAHVLRLARARELDWLAVTEEFARIPRVHAGEDFHQGRLAGAILAHQRVDFTRHKFELDFVKRPHAGKALAEPFDRNERGHGAALMTMPRRPPASSREAGREYAGRGHAERGRLTPRKS
jgi:hypothetical protein